MSIDRHDLLSQTKSIKYLLHQETGRGLDYQWVTENRMTLGEIEQTLTQALSPDELKDSLTQLLKTRWQRIRGCSYAYNEMPHNLTNQLCTTLAYLLFPIKNTEELNACQGPYFILMPTLKYWQDVSLKNIHDYTLGEFLLSERGDKFIPILQTFEYYGVSDRGQLLHQILNPEGEVTVLNQLERTRLINHSRQSQELYRAIQKKLNICLKGYTLGAFLQRLCLSLRKGSVQNNYHATELNAAQPANVGIVQFNQYWLSLRLQDRQRFFSQYPELKEIIDRLFRPQDSNYKETRFCVHLIANRIDDLLHRYESTLFSAENVGHFDLDFLEQDINRSFNALKLQLESGNLKTPANDWSCFTAAVNHYLHEAQDISSYDKECVLEELANKKLSTFIKIFYRCPNLRDTLCGAMNQLYRDKRNFILKQISGYGYDVLLLKESMYLSDELPLLTRLRLTHDEEEISLLLSNQEAGWNALMSAAFFHPDAFPEILATVIRLQSDSIKKQILNQENYCGHNVQDLLWKSNKHLYWDYVMTCIESEDETLKQTVLKQTDKNGWNALMTAVCNGIDLTVFLSSIGTLESNTLKREVLTQRSSFGMNLIDIMLENDNHGYWGYLQNCINSTDDVIKQIVFKQVDKNNRNALMLAAMHNHHFFSTLLSAIKNLNSRSITQTILRQVDNQGQTVFMILARTNPKALPLLLDMIKLWPDEVKKNLLRQCNHHGQNFLSILWKKNQKQYGHFIPTCIKNSDAVTTKSVLTLSINLLPFEVSSRLLLYITSKYPNLMPELVLEISKWHAIDRQSLLNYKQFNGNTRYFFKTFDTPLKAIKSIYQHDEKRQQFLRAWLDLLSNANGMTPEASKKLIQTMIQIGLDKHKQELLQLINERPINKQKIILREILDENHLLGQLFKIKQGLRVPNSRRSSCSLYQAKAMLEDLTSELSSTLQH